MGAVRRRPGAVRLRATAGGLLAISRLVALALAVAWIGGCASPPPRIGNASIADEPVIGGLYRVRASGIGAAYLKPGVNLSPYDSVVIDPVTVAAKENPAPPAGSRHGPSSSGADAAEMNRLKEIFRESFERELARSEHFTVATEAGPGTLRISGHVVDLVIERPPPAGRDVGLVMSAGEMTLVLDVRDSRTGEPLARLADRQALRPKSAGLSLPYKSTPVKTWGAVRDIATDWARVLRHVLEDLREAPEEPVPAAPEG